MNVSTQISLAAQAYPHKNAVVAPIKRNKDYVSYSFFELEQRINQFAHRLLELDIKKGDKVILFIRPNIDFAAIVFAVFRIGAVAVFIDPGIGRKKLLSAVEEVQARVLIGMDRVHLLRRVFAKSFASVELFLTNSKNEVFAKSIYKDLKRQRVLFPMGDTDPADLAAIIFTSGGTGRPKGVPYSHAMFIRQTRQLQEIFKLSSDDVDLAGFPLFALFSLSLGMTSVIPFMNPGRPAKAKGAALIKNITDHQVSFVSGSPSIWKGMMKLCLLKGKTLGSVRSFVMFGAPISYQTHQDFAKILPNGTTYTPYGATECLPIALISGAQILNDFKEEEFVGKGVCVGAPIDGVQVKVIALGSEEVKELPPKEIGEIIVHSESMSTEYYRLPKKTKASKIQANVLWHKMGDTGYLDESGRLWFTGRVAHSFKLGFKQYFPIPIEQYFQGVKGVEKVAFVKVKSDETALIVEGKKRALHEIKQIIQLHDLPINHVQFHPAIPTDPRHNLKIDRQALRAWSMRRL